MGTSHEERKNEESSNQLNAGLNTILELFQQYELISTELLALDLKDAGDMAQLQELQQQLNGYSSEIQQKLEHFGKVDYPSVLVEVKNRCYDLQKLLQEKLVVHRLEVQEKFIGFIKQKKTKDAYSKGYQSSGYFIDTRTK